MKSDGTSLHQSNGAPISTISEDILLTIFRHVVFDWDWDSYGKLPSEPFLVSLSHTCQQWRTLALANTILWTNIDTYNVRRAQVFFERSLTLPVQLNIECNSENLDPEATYSLVTPHIARIRSLTLVDGESRDGDATVETWMEQLSRAGPATILDELVLRVDLRRGNFVIARPSHTINAPAVRALTLEQVYYPPSSPIFEDLKSLDLSDIDDYSLHDLVQILSASPRLQKLTLGSIFSLTGHLDVVPIVLPCLTHLTLDYIALPLAKKCLARFALPIVASISVAADDNDDEDMFAVFPTDKSTIAGLADIRFLSVCGHSGGPSRRGCVVRAYRENPPLHTAADESTSTSFLHFDLYNGHKRDALTSLARWLFPDADKLETLILADLFSPMSLDEWTTILRPFTRLRKLRLIMALEPTLSLLTAIRMSADTHLLPSLVELELCEFSRVYDQEGGKPKAATPTQLAEFWEALKGVVESRRAGDIPLKSLKLVDDACPPEHVDARREVARMVERFWVLVLPPESEMVVEGTGLTRYDVARSAREHGGYGQLYGKLGWSTVD